MALRDRNLQRGGATRQGGGGAWGGTQHQAERSLLKAGGAREQRSAGRSLVLLLLVSCNRSQAAALEPPRGGWGGGAGVPPPRGVGERGRLNQPTKLLLAAAEGSGMFPRFLLVQGPQVWVEAVGVAQLNHALPPPTEDANANVSPTACESRPSREGTTVH